MQIVQLLRFLLPDSAWLDSIRWTTTDSWWTALYALALALIVPLALIRGGRLLLLLSGLAAFLFIATNALLAGTWSIWLMLVWLTVVSHELGRATLQLLAPTSDLGASESVILSTAVGFGALALLVLPIGLLHLLNQSVIVGLLSALTALLLLRSGRRRRAALSSAGRRAVEAWARGDLRFPALAAAILAVSAAGPLLWALAPSIHFDALNYHLGVPSIYVREQAIVEVPEEFRSYWVHSAEMLYTLALVLVGQPLPSLIHMTFGLMTASLVFLLGRRLAGRNVGLIAAMLFYSMPLVSWESGVSYTDLIPAAYSFAMFYAVVRWLDTDDDLLLRIAGLLAGLSVATKLNAVLPIVPVFLIVAVTLICRRGRSLAVARGILSFSLPAIPPIAVWWLRDWLWTGNPIFPFYNAFFASPKWPIENTLFNFKTFGIGYEPIYFLRVPFDLTFSTSKFGEGTLWGAGIVPLLSLPWLYWVFVRRNGDLRRFLLVAGFCSVATFALWFNIGQYLRYLLPLLPILCILAALNVDLLRRRLASSPSKRAAAGLAVTIGVSYLLFTRVTFTLWGWQIPERYPYGVALGSESPQAFLSRALPVYDALQFLSQKLEGSRAVLSVGNEFRMYSKPRIASLGGSPSLGLQVGGMSPSISLSQMLVSSGYDYLLIDQNQTRAHPSLRFPVQDQGFLRDFAELEFARSNVYVYRLLAGGRGISAQSPNLVTNAGFEESDQQDVPASWRSYGKPTMRQSTTGAHSGEVAVLATRQDGLVQRVSTVAGRIYTLGHWVRADRPDQLARLQINWLDDKFRMVDVSIDVVPAGPDWAWHYLSANAPAVASFADVYVSVHEDSAVWFDDFQLVQGAGDQWDARR